MKKADVQINGTYLVKVAGNLVPVKITREHDNGGWEGRSIKTGKTIRIKSPQRLRKCLDDAAHGAKSAAKATKDATDAPHAPTIRRVLEKLCLHSRRVPVASSGLGPGRNRASPTSSGSIAGRFKRPRTPP